MITKMVIDEVKKRLIKTYKPVKIYLFGSYAWGNPSEESDLDVLVIVEKSDEKNYKRPIPGLLALFGLMISKDLLVLTLEEFVQRSSDKTTLAYKIKHKGKMIYAKA